MLEEYQVVILVRPEDDVPISVGTKGTVLMSYGGPPVSYEIEFLDQTGAFLGVFTIKGENLEVAADTRDLPRP